MSSLTEFMPVYIDRLENKLNDLRERHTALEQDEARARDEAARWQDACVGLVAAIRQVIDESNGTAGGPLMLTEAGASDDDRSVGLGRIRSAAELLEGFGGPGRSDPNRDGAPRDGYDYLTRLTDVIAQASSGQARIGSDRPAGAPHQSVDLARHRTTTPDASDAEWAEGVSPFAGPWIEVPYEEVTFEDATSEDDPAATAESTSEPGYDEGVTPQWPPADGGRQRAADRSTRLDTSTFDVIAYPFTRFSALRSFQKSMRALPGMRSVRLSHYGQVALQFRVEYAGNVPLAEQLSALRGFPGTVSADAPGRLVLSLTPVDMRHSA